MRAAELHFLGADDETRPRFARPPEWAAVCKFNKARPDGRALLNLERTTRFELATLTLAR